MQEKIKNPRTLFAIGGLIASILLLGFGVASVVLGYQGRQDVRDRLAEENIIGTEDSSIPGQLVDTGAEAKAFADVMRKHTLASTDGRTYSELPRYIDENGAETNDRDLAAKDEFGNPIANPLRDLWVTETALTTALNTAYFAEQVATFSIVVGVALIVTAIGFLVLNVYALWRIGETREAEEAVRVGAAKGAPVQH
ncbi:MAG: hypothetical protein Kow0010_26160 [Dehalococcoidia bacterium]